MVSLIRGNRGQSVVEFALVLPMLLLVLFGIASLGRAVMTKNILTSAAREGARLAIVTAPNVGAVQARVTEVCAAAGVTPSAITVSEPAPDTGIITVRVESHFALVPGAGIFNTYGDGSFPAGFTIGATSVMRHESLQP